MRTVTGHRAALLTAAICLGAAVSPLAGASASAAPSVEELETAVDNATEELETATQDYDEATGALENLKRQRDATAETVESLRSDAADAAAEVDAMASALYTAGPAAVTPFIAGPPSLIAERFAVLDYLGHDRAVRAATLADTTTALAEQESRIEAVSAARDTLADTKSELKSGLDDSMSELATVRAESATGYRGGPVPSMPDSVRPEAARAVEFAYKALGSPYQWGGSGPAYDCSGLTAAAWAAAGVILPHNTNAQFDAVTHVERGELQPGDLVFYFDDIHHVAIYVGRGEIIHAPTEGQTVQLAGMDVMPVHGYGRPG